MTSKIKVMPVRIIVSFQMYVISSPLIMIDFTIVKYHFDGTMLEMTRSGNGMFSIGNINPLNSKVGSIVIISELNMADCCDFAEIDINNPSANEVKIKIKLSAYNNRMLPLNGI